MRNDLERAERTLARIILPISATMVGVCATIIGLVKVVETRAGPSRVDEYAALVMILFLISTVASYLSIRRGDRGHGGVRLELLADAFFILGLLAIAIVAFFFAYEVI